MFSAQFQARYRVDGRLAEGGMGVLWRGRHLELDVPVAIKTLRPELAPDTTAQERFLEEARLTARLAHANIVRALDCGRDDQTLFIVYEFIEGEDLRARLDRDGALPPAEFFRIGLGVARAVEHAHAQGVIHRDMKPENVLLGSDGRVLAGDFGLARCLEDRGQRTATGAMLGTLSYLSPEVASGQRAGPPSDVYALGLIAFEMLAGRRAFEAANAVAILRMHVDTLPPSLAELRADVPAPLQALLEQSLEKKPEQRPTAAEWRGRMEALAPQTEWSSRAQSGPGAGATPPDAVRSRGRDRTIQRRQASPEAPRVELQDRAGKAAPMLAPKAVDRGPRPVPPLAGTPGAVPPASGPAAATVSPLTAAMAAAACTLALSAVLFRTAPPPAPIPPPPVSATPPATPPAAPPRRPPPAPATPPPEAPIAPRSLDRLRTFLTGPGAPDPDQVRLDSRAYTFTLGEPFGVIPTDVDGPTREKEIRRLAAVLTRAAAWEPPGGLDALLQEAARRLDDPTEKTGSKVEFLDTIGPRLDLEAIASARGLSSRTPYFDFLYGKGKAKRKFWVMRSAGEADLDALLAAPGEPPGRERRGAWRKLEVANVAGSGGYRGDERWAVWFHKFALPPDPAPRLLASECRKPDGGIPSSLAGTKRPRQSRRDEKLLERGNPGPINCWFSMPWKPDPAGRAELWARTSALRRAFRFDVQLAGWVAASFRLHPEVWNQQDPPAALVFDFPSIALDVAPGGVGGRVELHLLAGEDVFTDRLPPEAVSMSPVGLALRQLPAGP